MCGHRSSERRRRRAGKRERAGECIVDVRASGRGDGWYAHTMADSKAGMRRVGRWVDVQASGEIPGVYQTYGQQTRRRLRRRSVGGRAVGDWAVRLAGGRRLTGCHIN